MRIEVFGKTDIGLIRPINEDSFNIYGFDDNLPHGFCILADGMGGHNAGEVASNAATDIISNELASSFNSTTSENLAYNISGAIDFANNRIYNMSISNREHAGMGTTLVLTYVLDNTLWIANIGDSRAYIIKNNIIKQITTDHSVVEQLVETGSITREEALVHPDKNIITRALGTEPFVNADFFEYTPEEGDTILMCSDGLSEMVRDEIILKTVREMNSLDAAINNLIENAKQSGGKDNITVVALRFE